MKKLSFIYILLAGLMIMASCKKEELGPVLDQVTPATLTTPTAGSTIVLAEDQADQMVSFSWTAADYGFQAAVTYTVQIDKAGNNFASALELFKTTELTKSVSVASLNNMLIANGYPDGVATNVDIRIVCSVSEYVDAVYSEVVALGMQPYMVVVDYPYIYVPGSYQGWDPSNETTIIYSLKSDNKYEGYMYFVDANVEFKYCETPNWSQNWGDNDADGTLEKDGANLKSTDPGMYKLNVNLNDKTHKFLKTDWGLIGSATPGGWDNDTNMTWDADNSVLTLTIDLVAGDIKFRANDDWAINLGDNDTNKSLEYDGSNIPVAEAGNYTITLDLKGPIFTYSVTKN